MLMSGLFPGFVFCSIAYMLRKAGVCVERGAPGRVVLKSRKKLRLMGDGGPGYNLCLEYVANGRKFHTWMDTPYPARLSDEAEEPISYAPQNPGEYILLDELPAHVELDDTGNLKHRYPLMGFVYLMIPLVTLVGMIYLTAK